ncbi:NDR1/HIN1-like protein [Fibrisoma limi]|nr:LEA type 2 family protein [Fibrisoma limi]
MLVLYILNKVNTAKQLEFNVGLPKNISLKGGQISFDLPLNTQNVSSGSVNVKSADFDVLSAGKFLGKALVLQPTTITPKGQTTLPVRVTISYFDLLSAAGSIVNLFKSGKIGLTLDGLVYAEGFQVPVKQSFEFDYKQIL